MNSGAQIMVKCLEAEGVEIAFGWEPTQEQMQLVGEMFGGLQ